jgi:hypothetical protein
VYKFRKATTRKTLKTQFTFVVKPLLACEIILPSTQKYLEIIWMLKSIFGYY